PPPVTPPPTAPAAPAPPPPAGPNTGRISLSAGIDAPTDYYFRGIVQETEDYILQPYGEVTFKLVERAGPMSNLGFTLGLWNSLHGGPTGVEGGAGGAESTDPKIWYEADFYAKLGATWWDNLTTALIYTAYMSPNDRFRTVQELALSVGYNDAGLLGPFALNPSLLVAFELDGQADAGRHRGVYLQLGVAPGVTFLEKTRTPVTITFPLLVGLSLSEYYEFGTGDDDTFGYFSGGVNAAVGLGFIPASFGSWSLKAGVSVLTLGDNLRRVNNRDDVEVIGTIGLAFTY
ncbi:MAG TPA: hypothetical protein VNO23_16870, partial [Candidatus Binatia bacterium]|nr:hypothetical protein [Candidatus Binatia bacterium]